MFYRIGLLKNFGKLTGKNLSQSFFLEKVARHQASNFIKMRHQHRCFTVNFAKLLKALCRTPPVSASNFNSTLLTLTPRKTYIYVFPALLFWGIFLSHFVFPVEAKEQIYLFYTKFSAKQAIFLTNVLVFCCAANQCSEITGFFFKIIKPKWAL